ncbi:hypothetical protein [Calidifontibacter indicus]|uniref:hypothetical protein n=1 Tax=Calidifontibacter indicus TaxID=419650 RepID=UPI003D714A0E
MMKVTGWLLAGAIVAGAASGATVLSANSSPVPADSAQTSVPFTQAGGGGSHARAIDKTLPRNKKGQTYGTLASSADDPRPDLVIVLMKDGKTGYVKAIDLESGPLPSGGPAPAGYTAPPRTIPVYDVEGGRVIGSFDIG